MTSSPFSIPSRVALGAALAAGLAWGTINALNPPPTTQVLAKSANLTLEGIRESGGVRSDLIPLPPPRVEDPGQRKALFIVAMLPLIMRENLRIERQRASAESAPEGSPRFSALAYGYGLHPNVARATLLERIDIVPASLALAQGAIESAWGTSRFAREGNAYFGERTYDEERAGLTPKESKNAVASFKVKSFARAHLSVRSFMRTLNTHPAYRALRAQRAALRARGQRPTGLALAPFLQGYSEIGTPYVRRVIAIIEHNRLDEFEGLRFVDE